MRPKGTMGANLTVRIVRAFFMRTTHDAVSHDDRLRPLRFDEREDLQPDGRGPYVHRCQWKTTVPRLTVRHRLPQRCPPRPSWRADCQDRRTRRSRLGSLE